MKKTLILTLAICFSITHGIFAQQAVQLITTDIDHFWNAYDKIVSTTDTAAQYGYLNQLFIEKATPGQLAMIKARNYTPKQYLEVIHSKQSYFNSIRKNTLKAKDYASATAKKTERFKQIYPALRPAKIYFTVGAFRSGGTTKGNMVLIGSEIAMADEHLADLVATNVHEYVHTQQKSTMGENLLAQSVMEGVAEFVAEQVMGKSNPLPAFSYGKAHADTVRRVFGTQMFSSGTGFWLYSDAENQFGVRDLGYYVGYAIAQAYHQKATNKIQAVKEMIELDILDSTALEAYVDKSGYFADSVKLLKAAYENNRPQVISAVPLKTGTLDGLTTFSFTVNFSKPMDTRFRSFELGPLGEGNLMRVKTFKGFAADGKSAELVVAIKPGNHYQLVIGDGFRDQNGLRLKPYLIDFKPLDE